MADLFPISRRRFFFSSLALSSSFFCRGEIYPAANAAAELSSTFNPFSFVFVSDCHLSNHVPDSYKLTQESQLFLQEAIKQINVLKPDFVIFGGDQVDGPGDEDANWQFFLDIMQSLDAPWHFVLGEADVSGNLPVNKMHTYGRDWKGLGLTNSQPYWCCDPLPGVHMIGLDTSVPDSMTGYMSQEQIDWLKNDLAQQTGLTILASHHPLLPPAPFDQNAPAQQYLLPQAQAVREILQGHNQPILSLNGHVHTNKVTRQGNVFYISSASLDVYPCTFRYFQVTPQQVENKICQVNFPALVKKAKSNLMTSSFASEITAGHPRNFVNEALGSHYDQNTCFSLLEAQTN